MQNTWIYLTKVQIYFTKNLLKQSRIWSLKIGTDPNIIPENFSKVCTLWHGTVLECIVGAGVSLAWPSTILSVVISCLPSFLDHFIEYKHGQDYRLNVTDYRRLQKVEAGRILILLLLKKLNETCTLSSA